jgi:hypothetical protein
MLFEACNSVNDGPKKGKPGAVISIDDRESSSALTILDSLTLRSKLFSGDVYTLSVYQGLNDTVRIYTNQVTPLTSDTTWYFTGDGSYSNGTFSVPSGNGKYWIVYFDPGENPQVQIGGPVCEIECNCTSCDIEVKNYQLPDEGCKCTSTCQDNSECKESNQKTPFVLIKAEYLIFNNVLYQ